MRLQLLPDRRTGDRHHRRSSGIGLVTAKQAARRGARGRARRTQRARPAPARSKTSGATAGAPSTSSPTSPTRSRSSAIADAAIARVRPHRHVGEQRRRVDVRPHHGAADRGHAPADGRQLLGPGVRLARRPSRTCATAAARSSTSAARCPIARSRCRGTTAPPSTRSRRSPTRLRMELEEEGVPISVTLVKPASIDTPFFEKAKTYLGVEPQPVPPVYAPEVVAGGDPPRRAAPASRADCRRRGRQAERRPVRAAARRQVHGALDVRFAADRTAGGPQRR